MACKGYAMVCKGCVMVCKGCVMVCKGCVMVRKGCVMACMVRIGCVSKASWCLIGQYSPCLMSMFSEHVYTHYI